MDNVSDTADNVSEVDLRELYAEMKAILDNPVALARHLATLLERRTSA